MFQNQYDTDVTVWSPQGRLYQVEYAMHAVRQGSACVGFRSKTHVVLAALKRRTSELATHQQKVFNIDDHMGIAIAGLTADARSLAKYMQTEALNHKYVFETPVPVGRLVSDVADKHQACTQSYVRRPYGVGLLVAGVDRTGPHLYETSPSGNFFEYKGIAIGARAQAAKTYIARVAEEQPNHSGFDDADAETLILHGIRSLRGCVQGDQELTSENVVVSVVGVDSKFRIIENDAIVPYLQTALGEGGGDAAAAAGAGAGAADQKEADEDED
jgi:20S proteasome subunit alpha 6